MADDKNLRRFHLTEDKDKGDATKDGALADALGKQGGSVRIHKQDGEIQEERTFPRSRDPKGSPG